MKENGAVHMFNDSSFSTNQQVNGINRISRLLERWYPEIEIAAGIHLELPDFVYTASHPMG